MFNLKKSLAISLCAATVFCAASCGDVQSSTSETTHKNPSISIIETRPPNETVITDFEYMTFEEMCAEADYIVVANYVDAVNYNDDYAKFTINVKEAVYGDISGQIDIYLKDSEAFKTSLDGREIQFRESAYVVQEKTDDVVLFLKYEENPEGLGFPVYTWQCAPTVNLTKLGMSQMYNEHISHHITGIYFTVSTPAEVLEYIRTLAAQKNAK